MRWLLAGLTALVALVVAVTVPVGDPEPLPVRRADGWRVEGATLVDGGGAAFGVAGVSRAGTEYACAQGWGLFDGPVDAEAVRLMTTWGVNAVRVPLNQSCWLGLPGVKAEYGGRAYRDAVRGWVDRLRAEGLLVLLELHLSAPGGALALEQAPMPDAESSPAFWTSVATEYRDVPGTAFELFNEPRDVDWRCWRDGCAMPGGWQAAGMQQLLDAVRATGARQPVVVEGLGYGNDLSGWLEHRPVDPVGQLVAGWHAYQHSPCNDRACYDRTVAPVAEQVPVVLTEVGQDDCGRAWFDDVLAWADEHRLHYLAWTWNDWPGCGGPTLLRDYDGTPTELGVAYRDRVRARVAA